MHAKARAEKQQYTALEAPVIADYILTFEVRFQGQPVGQWSGNLELRELDSAETPVRLWEVMPSWFEEVLEVHRASEVVVTMFVTYKMSTAQIFKIDAWFDESEDEDEAGILQLRLLSNDWNIPIDGFLSSTGRFRMQFYHDDHGEEAADSTVRQDRYPRTLRAGSIPYNR